MIAKLITIDDVAIILSSKDRLPGGVIGNTQDSGSCFPGSSPGWAAKFCPCFRVGKIYPEACEVNCGVKRQNLRAFTQGTSCPLVESEMKREKWLLTLAAVFIGIATSGFLILQNPRLENKIRDKHEENIGLVSSQQKVADYMEKSNYYRELATLIEADQDILKSLNAPNEVAQRHEDNRLYFYRGAVLDAINAIKASKKWDEVQGDEKEKEINTLTVGELHDKYLEYMEIAAETTRDLQKRIDDNGINILNLEKNKNRWFYIFFFFQSLGLIFGLFAIVSRKVE